MRILPRGMPAISVQAGSHLRKPSPLRKQPGSHLAEWVRLCQWSAEFWAKPSILPFGQCGGWMGRPVGCGQLSIMRLGAMRFLSRRLPVFYLHRRRTSRQTRCYVQECMRHTRWISECRANAAGMSSCALCIVWFGAMWVLPRGLSSFCLHV